MRKSHFATINSPVVVLTGLTLLPHLTVNVRKTKGASFNTFIRLTAGFTINVMT